MWFVHRLSVALLLLVLVGCTAKQPPEPIQVAHLLPLTGPDKKAAEDAQHGMMFAVEAVNADEQRVGGRSVVVRNIDTAGDPEVIQAETVRLVTLNKVVAFVAGLDSRGAEQLVRSAQSYSIPVVVPDEFPPGTGLEGFLTLDATPTARGELLAHYVVKELKPKHAVVLTDQRNPIAVDVATAFVHEWPRSGSAKLEEWPFRNDTEQIDFAANLTKLAPAVALFAGTPADFLKLQGQLNAAKAAVTLLYGGEDVGSGPFLKADAETLLATVFATEGLTDKGKEFASRYEERYHEPPSFAAAQAYDAGRLLFETMQRAKTGNTPKLRDELMKVDSFDSVTGKVTWKDRKPQRPVFVVRIKNGETKVVQTLDPEEK